MIDDRLFEVKSLLEDLLEDCEPHKERKFYKEMKAARDYLDAAVTYLKRFE